MPAETYDVPAIVGCAASGQFDSGRLASQPSADFQIGDLTDGLTLTFDVQPSQFGTHTLVEIASPTRSSRLTVQLQQSSVVAAQLTIFLTDEAGRVMEAHAGLSPGLARRCALTVKSGAPSVTVRELQPWAAQPGIDLPVEYVRDGCPQECNFTDGLFIVAGALGADGPEAAFTGRLANLGIWRGLIEFDQLLEESLKDNPCSLRASEIGAQSNERVARFGEDAARLTELAAQPLWSYVDMTTASLILSRWLFDTRKLLCDLARKTGVQLWLPGTTDQQRGYEAAIRRLSPDLYQAGDQWSPTAPLGYQWVPVEDWGGEPAFRAHSHEISRESFVKFVRNKLNGVHFDEDERTRWQRELIELTSKFSLADTEPLVFQMRSLARCVIIGLRTCGLEILLV